MIGRIITGIITIMIGVTLVSEISHFNNGLNLVGWTLDDSKEKDKPHKQTYLEYVKERLEVERLMRRS